MWSKYVFSKLLIWVQIFCILLQPLFGLLLSACDRSSETPSLSVFTTSSPSFELPRPPFIRNSRGLKCYISDAKPLSCFSCKQLEFDANCFSSLFDMPQCQTCTLFCFLSFHLLFPLLFTVWQKRRRPTTGGQLDDKRREMLKRHPLSLCLDLKCKGNSFYILHKAF